jgi:biopolymer transport protein ExbD
MKNIKFTIVCLLASFVAACSGASLTPMQDAMKRSYPPANVPKNIRNAKPDAHFADEKAIVVSVLPHDNLYVGDDQYAPEIVREAIEKRLGKNPSEKQLIYLNTDFSDDYGNVVKVLDTIRRTGVENIGLMVEPASDADKKLQVLKVKLSAEPKEDDPADLLDRRLVINLQKDGKIKLGRYDKYEFKASTPDIAETEVGAKLAPLLTENEEKKYNLRGTNEIDKTVFVKAPRAKRCVDVVRLVDAAVGAGASEVYLMLDDLE